MRSGSKNRCVGGFSLTTKVATADDKKLEGTLYSQQLSAS